MTQNNFAKKKSYKLLVLADNLEHHDELTIEWESIQ